MYHGLAIQAMADSSRYFVIKVTQGGKTAHLGLGFSDSADSFGINTTLHHQGIYKGNYKDFLMNILTKKESLTILDAACSTRGD